jgi:arylsulfatase A
MASKRKNYSLDICFLFGKQIILYLPILILFADMSEIQAAEKQPPNIVFILADDQGLHEVGCYGNSFYETPFIDSLAKEGMKFLSAYAACPVCSPTRASIMTGQYPARLHITDYIPGKAPKKKLKTPQWQKSLPLSAITIPEGLSKSGYVSGHFGKWHLNQDKYYKAGRKGDPASQGFHDVLTTVKPKKTDDPDKDAHHVKQITDRAIQFIRKNSEKPFFCYVAHHSIHSPLMESKNLIQKYQDKKGSDLPYQKPVVGAMIETLDRHVGRLLKTLDDLHLSEKTIVIYFSDNGCMWGSDSVKPLRGGKAQLLEGGIHVPMIVRWPGTVPVGSQSDVPVSSIDFFPTLLAAANVPVKDQQFDGINLIPLLNGKGKIKRDALYWHFPHYHSLGRFPAAAIREGKYKLIENFEISINPETSTPAYCCELYDLSQDPSEQTNLSGVAHFTAARLLNKLKMWKREVGAQEMTLDSTYQAE